MPSSAQTTLASRWGAVVSCTTPIWDAFRYLVFLDGNPGNGDDNVHALAVGSLPLVRVGSVFLVIPECADSAVHAAAALLLDVCGRGAVVLDDGAVGNVFVGGLRGRVWAG